MVESAGQFRELEDGAGKCSPGSVVFQQVTTIFSTQGHHRYFAYLPDLVNGSVIEHPVPTPRATVAMVLNG